MDVETYIKGHEGCRLEVYHDSLGFPTIGWGHLCVKNEYSKITQEQADELFLKDLAEAKFLICHLLPEFCTFSDNRKMALLDMAFQLGNRLTHFPKALSHVRAQEWEAAADDFLDSIWAKKQTPARAMENALLLIEG